MGVRVRHLDIIYRNIEVFKILNGYENIDSNIFLEIKEI